MTLLNFNYYYIIILEAKVLTYNIIFPVWFFHYKLSNSSIPELKAFKTTYLYFKK